METKTTERTRTMTGLNPAGRRTGATNTDERIGAGGLRRFALSAILGLAILAASLGSARAARATSCSVNGCQYWEPNGGMAILCDGTWQPLTQGCFWSPQYSNWFYCGSQWAGHYVPDQDANGWWWYQRKSDQAWYYMFAAQDAAGGWFFKPYEDSADCGTETDELMNASTYLEGNEILLNNHISGILE